MSVVKLLACMLAIHLMVIVPNALFPYVHHVHSNRSLEPKFRVGSGAGVFTRPAFFLGKNSRLVIPRRDLLLNRTHPIPWYVSTAVTADTDGSRPFNSGPRPGFLAPGNVSTNSSWLTHPHLFDSRQVLEVPKVMVETKLDYTTTQSSHYSNPQPFSALSHYSWYIASIPSLQFVGAGNITVSTTADVARVHFRRLDTYEHGVHAKYIRRIERILKKWYRRDSILYGGLGALPCGALCCMFSGGGGHRGHSQIKDNNMQYRMPPGWGPEDAPRYSFRAWSTDVRLWSMITDLKPEAQAAAIILRLNGHARDAARCITAEEIEHGGIMQGRRMGPVSYILAGLAMRYGQLGDESRLQAITEYQCFHKYPGERIDEFLSRFNVVRIRAEQDGGFQQSIELHSLQLMRSMNLNPQQFSTFLTPFGLRLPTTIREFEELQSHMRRIFHLTEHAPGNIGQSLHAPRQARAGTYYQGAQQAFTSTPSLVDQMSNSPGYGEEYAVHPAFDFQIPDGRPAE